MNSTWGRLCLHVDPIQALSLKASCSFIYGRASAGDHLCIGSDTLLAVQAGGCQSWNTSSTKVWLTRGDSLGHMDIGVQTIVASSHARTHKQYG